MCGIAGLFNTGGAPPDDKVLARMSGVIEHRGPDGERFFVDGGLGLAHRHLRIIDLSDAALQPMKNEDGSLWLIFNGEIYNYVELRPELEARGHNFSSHSDTETILHAYEEWGVDCLSHFNGMFAFALWDRRRGRLFLARDRIGVKPLYYSWHNGTLVFGSEIKALLQHPSISVAPNVPAIAEYMSAMYTTGEHTWFRGVKRLLPGHWMLVDRSGITIRRWWHFPSDEDEPGAHPESYYIDRTREILEDSVKLRLRSDVPLGAHLSGGLDSSAIVALNSNLLAPSGEVVRTFSGAFAEGPAYDERRYVRDVVRMYHTDHHETVPAADDLPLLLDRMIWHMDEPAAGPGLLLQYKVCELTRRSGVVVINGGQGGDEEWAGYFGYVPPYLRVLARQARQNPGLAGELAADVVRLALSPAMRTSMFKAISQGRRGRLEATSRLGAWAGPIFGDMSDGPYREPQLSDVDLAAGNRGALGRAIYNDIMWYLPALLQVEDRMSMAFSLESRAPLLDYRLVEHAARTPSALKMKNLEMKHIFRRAIGDLLPESVLRRKDKMGMPTPVAPWLRGSLAAWARSELTGPAANNGLLDPAFVHSCLDEHLSGRRDRSIDIWKMLNMVAWWRIFVEGEAQVMERHRQLEAAKAVVPA